MTDLLPDPLGDDAVAQDDYGRTSHEPEAVETEEGVVEATLERKLTVETEEWIVETALERKFTVETKKWVVETALERRKLTVETDKLDKPRPAEA